MFVCMCECVCVCVYVLVCNSKCVSVFMSTAEFQPFT